MRIKGHVLRLILLLLIVTVASRAQQGCPWLNAATASGILHGDAQMTVDPLRTNGDTTCHFTRGHGIGAASLEIEVHTAADPITEFTKLYTPCSGMDLPMRAVGNQAFQCASQQNNQVRVQIVGRVRDRLFRITVNSPKGDPLPDSNKINPEIQNLAEQVAGVLF